MEKNLSFWKILNCLIAVYIFCGFCSGCAPTYPKEKLTNSLVDICRKEYNVDVQAQLKGKTIIVFIPLDELFDSKLDILPAAVEKIENVILTTSRVILSTDAEIDFYTIIAADIKTTAAEFVLVRYMPDVYKLMNGWISRDEYRMRVLWEVNFNPSVLNRKVYDFNLDEARLAPFLAKQIAQRLNIFFDSSVVYKVKVKGDYFEEGREFSFSMVTADVNAFKKIYTPVTIYQAQKVLSLYGFGEFDMVKVKNELLRNTFSVTKDELKNYININADDLLTLPLYP
ncbi:MAG: hypothetical protein HY810_02635 [Candidatus Omnitrophica bacterium]|nr:hypothetical protein [Candidatus Omnitrophota bacterium]